MLRLVIYIKYHEFTMNNNIFEQRLLVLSMLLLLIGHITSVRGACSLSPTDNA